MREDSNLNVAFVMEQHLGHRAFYQNIRRFMGEYSEINPTWVDVAYAMKGQFIERLPFLPGSIKGTIAGALEARTGLATRSFDAAVFNTQVPAALAGNLLYRQPYIVCTDITPIQYDRMSTHYHHQPDKPGIISKYKHQVNKKVFQQASWILPWSTWTQSSLIEDYGVAPDRIMVNPPGVDLDVWRPGERNESGPLRVLFVGGDFYRKGGELLLEACRGLPEGTIELILVTRSEIPGNQWIKVYHHLQPNSAELIQLYQKCDAFVLPTQAEAFGIAAAEACAAGLPILATPVGGLTDIVEDGINGFLIPADQPEILRERLLLLAEEPGLRDQMGGASRRIAEAKFDARKNVARMVDIICQVAARSSST